MTQPAGPRPAALTPHVALRRVSVLVNTASGGVGPAAPAEIAEILRRFGVEADIAAPPLGALAAALEAAVAAKPDLLVVLAGDGTARAAAALCGPDGPLVAPLPGGTMNLLPHALYGRLSWQAALTAALSHGVERPVSGGLVDGVPFFVAGILGSPALWAPAREEARRWRLQRAFRRARLALRATFSGKLRFSLDGANGRAEALTLICPLVSRAMTEENGLEAVAIDPSGPGEVVRVGLRALAVELFGPWTGDWRNDPVVSAGVCRSGRVWSKRHIPAVLDGEPVRFGRQVKFQFVDVAFRALASAPDAPGQDSSAL
jgi:diacylglycerol kinase family enzyme